MLVNTFKKSSTLSLACPPSIDELIQFSYKEEDFDTVCIILLIQD